MTNRLLLLAALPLALMASACGSTVSSEDGEDDGSGGGPTTTTSGTSGQSTSGQGGGDCLPDDDAGNCEFGSVCVDGEWTCLQHECPASEPTPGLACPLGSEGQSCDYEIVGDCMNASVRYTCDGGSWSEGTYPRCSPLVCRDFTDAASCDSVGCRWLEPGCGEDPVPLREAGCFDLADCTEGSCWSGDEICMPVSVEPACADEGCNACGETVIACVPQVVGR